MFATLPLLCLVLQSTAALNTSFNGLLGNHKTPVIFVHGFFGWGRDELFGIKYWGSLHGDLEADLRERNIPTFTATVGPVSSNWDRACELYAQIKGGTVDYGLRHSATHRHKATGRTHPGLYPEWGTKDEHGNVRKVHLIGHSMGGLTVRLLNELLVHGTKHAPSKEDASNPESLFYGGKQWVHSISTFASPHEGTMIANGLSLVKKPLIGLLTKAATFLGAFGDLRNVLYDFKLDHFNMHGRYPGESFVNYVYRMFDNPVFTDPSFTDVSIYDLSTTGVEALNRWVKIDPNVFYFSYATRDSYDSSAWHDWGSVPVQRPHLFTMNLALQPVSLIIGGIFTTINQGKSVEWQPNDGVTNTLSTFGTFSDPSVEYNGHAVPGRWHKMPLVDRVDHLAVISLTLRSSFKEVYFNHVGILQNLPESYGRFQTGSMSSEDQNRFHNIQAAVSHVKQEAEELDVKAQIFQSKDQFCASQPTHATRRYCEVFQSIEQ